MPGILYTEYSVAILRFLPDHPPPYPHGHAGESVTKLKGMLTAAQEANPPTKEISKSGFSFRHPDAPPAFDDVSLEIAHHNRTSYGTYLKQLCHTAVRTTFLCVSWDLVTRTYACVSAWHDGCNIFRPSRSLKNNARLERNGREKWTRR